jgi:hypothetical protein
VFVVAFGRHSGILQACIAALAMDAIAASPDNGRRPGPDSGETGVAMSRHAPAPTSALAAVVLAGAFGQAHAADATIESLLKQAGTPYEIDKDGDYKIVVSWSQEKRSQLVFVGGTPETFAGMPVYDVFAPALAVESGALGQDDANKLLDESGKMKLGAWELRGDGAYYAVKVPAGQLTADQFDKILSLVAETADDFELAHSNGASDDL